MAPSNISSEFCIIYQKGKIKRMGNPNTIYILMIGFPIQLLMGDKKRFHLHDDVLTTLANDMMVRRKIGVKTRAVMTDIHLLNESSCA